MRPWFLVVVACACGGPQGFHDFTDASAYDDDAHADYGFDSSVGFAEGGVFPPKLPEICTPPVLAVDTSSPTTVVTPCTEATLRAAVATGGIVTFGCGSAKISVGAEIVVSTDTVIDGAGRVAIAGTTSSRIFHATNGAHVTLQNLSFTGGGAVDGGEIFADGASLTVIDSVFAKSKAAGAGGFIATSAPGSLVITGSKFDTMTADTGGAVAVRGTDAVIVNSWFSHGAAATGGAISIADAPATLCGDVLTTNKATTAGGALHFAASSGAPALTLDRVNVDASGIDLFTGDGAGIYVSGATLAMKRSTIAHGIGHIGGGAFIDTSNVALENVTIWGNEAYRGAGVWFSNASGSILNCTIAFNQGGGIDGGGPTILLDDSIVAINQTNLYDDTVNCDHTLSTSRPSLEWPASSVACTAGVLIADPLLGALQDNGGAIKTSWPASGSPAIAAGKDCALVDALNHPRPSACTLGAVEP